MSVSTILIYTTIVLLVMEVAPPDWGTVEYALVGAVLGILHLIFERIFRSDG